NKQPSFSLAVGTAHPGDTGDVDAIVGEGSSFLLGTLAINPAPLGLAMVNPARLLGEIGADIFTMGLHLLAQPLQHGARGIGDLSARGGVDSGRHWQGGLRGFFTLARNTRGHERARDMRVGTNRTGDQPRRAWLSKPSLLANQPSN